MKTNKNTNPKKKTANSNDSYMKKVFDKEHDEAVKFRKGNTNTNANTNASRKTKAKHRIKPTVSIINPVILDQAEKYLKSVGNNICFVDFVYLFFSGIVFESFNAFKACLKYIGFWIMVGLTAFAVLNTLNYFLDNFKF